MKHRHTRVGIGVGHIRNINIQFTTPKCTTLVHLGSLYVLTVGILKGVHSNLWGCNLSAFQFSLYTSFSESKCLHLQMMQH